MWESHNGQMRMMSCLVSMSSIRLENTSEACLFFGHSLGSLVHLKQKQKAAYNFVSVVS